MKYVGSKNRHARHILPLILSGRLEGQWYVEPFVGGFNCIDKVSGRRIGSDSNKFLIALFRAVVAGWTPPDSVDYNEYVAIRDNKNDFPAHLVGFVGFGCSYSGKWFGGYARGNDTKGVPRNYCSESKRNILSQVDSIKGVDIREGDYFTLEIPDNSIIYCDPPYKNTTSPYSGDSIDYEEFWDWVRLQKLRGHRIYVSEYEAPEDFTKIWSREVNNTLNQDTGEKKGLEGLFTLQ
jgi:DNA adenine methylase